MLQLHLEQSHKFDRDTRDTGNPDDRVLVGTEDLLDVALGDQVAHGGPAIAGHHNPTVEGRGNDRGAVRGQVRTQAAGPRQRFGGNALGEACERTGQLEGPGVLHD